MNGIPLRCPRARGLAPCARPRALRVVLLLAAAACAGPASRRGVPEAPRAAADTVDVLIAGGRVVDGTGAVPRAADVAIRDGRILRLLAAGAPRPVARRTIDATGLVVTPGFIDPHVHALLDLGDSATSRLDYALAQGVTTVVTGNDGGGPVDVGAALARWRRNGTGPNVATYIGHGSVRDRVMGRSPAAPTDAQLDAMRGLVRRAMADGAIGLSSGLYYAPGSWATTREVTALAAEVAPFGGVYDTHLRDESSYTVGLLDAVREAIAIGRDAGVPVHIAHVKALGADVWGRSDSVTTIIEAARARGQRVTADQYPYLASGTSLGAALLPRWAEAGGTDSLRARFADASLRSRLVADMQENLRRRGGAETLLITRARDTTLVGRTLAELAAARGVDAIATAIAILTAESPGVASFNMTQADVDALATRPWVVTGSDGSEGHPRKYGAFAKALREFVVERRLLTLETFVARSSGTTAALLGLTDRGVLRDGAWADVLVFDPAAVRDEATFDAPERLATGMRWVFVNGVAVIADGVVSTARPGNVPVPRLVGSSVP